MDISDLLLALKSNGVKRFEIEFDQSSLRGSSTAEQGAVNAPAVGSSPTPAATHDVPRGTQAQDLPGANDLMSDEEVLNWSAPPGPDTKDQEAIAGTGDAPILTGEP